MTVELMGIQEAWAVDIDDMPDSPYSGNSYTVMINDDELTGMPTVEVFNPDKDENVLGDEQDFVVNYLEKHKEEK